MPMKNFLRSFLLKMPLVGDVRAIRHELAVQRQQLQTLQTTLQTASATVLNDFQLESHPRYGDRKRLLRYAAQVTSQNGEDGMINEIFRRIQHTNRIFVEVGMGDGSENNTAFLLTQGWRGFWIDGNKDFLRNIEQRTDLAGGCLRGMSTFVTKENITPIFSQLNIPAEFDLLSIDIDQNTYHVWEALHGFRPRVVIVEYNSSVPPDIDWKVNYAPDRVWDGTNNFGGSLKAFEILGRKLKYSLVGCDFIGANAFFVRDDIVADNFAQPFTAENHYEPPRYSLLHRRGHRACILDRVGDA
jgi:hypothetical protein